jgi:serine/threonine protein phosphatase PrpC
LNIETAQVSLIGDRQNNQDRETIIVGDTQILLVVADGMGGHAEGAAAAQTAVDTLTKSYKAARKPITDAGEFLFKGIEAAHRAVVRLGASVALDERPRTTVTACLMEEGQATWAHVGDSRIYLLRAGAVEIRTRDHSAVEALYREGRISADEMLTHPMRNFVDQCLGGEPETPEIEVAEPAELRPADVMLLCSDGFWAPLNETHVAQALCTEPDVEETLERLSIEATQASSPHSDNVTAVALRWLGPDEDEPPRF